MPFWRAPSPIFDAMSFVFGGFGKNYREISKRDAQGGWAAKNLQNLSFSGILKAQQTFHLNRMEESNYMLMVSSPNRIKSNAKGPADI